MTPHHNSPPSPAAAILRLIATTALIAMPAIATAADVPVGMTRIAVPVRGVDLHPASPAAARRLLARLREAAVEACGASPASLRELRLDARASTCWRDAMADAVARIDSPMLSAAYRGGPAPRRFDTAAACTKETPCPAPSN